jgi:hypothetical protein
MSDFPASDASYGRAVPLRSPRWSNVHTLVTLCSLIYLLQFIAHVASGNATTFEDDSFDGTRGVLTDLLSLLFTCVGTTLLLKGWFPGPSSWRASARKLDSTMMVLALNSFVETCNFFMDNQLRYGHVRANLWKTPILVSRGLRDDAALAVPDRTAVTLELEDHCAFDDAFWKVGTKLHLFLGGHIGADRALWDRIGSEQDKEAALLTILSSSYPSITNVTLSRVEKTFTFTIITYDRDRPTVRWVVVEDETSTTFDTYHDETDVPLGGSLDECLQSIFTAEGSIAAIKQNDDASNAKARKVTFAFDDDSQAPTFSVFFTASGQPVAQTTLRAVERQGGGLSLLRTMGYLIDPEVVCKASLVVVLSSMTCYVLSDLVAGVVRERVASRYVGLVAFAVTGVLASIPTNTVRFGWAYRSRRDETVRTGLVVLVYTLTSVVYMTYTSTDDRSRDQAEVRREKLALVTSSLFFIVLYDTLSSADAASNSDGGDDGQGTAAPRSCAKHFVRYLVPLDEGLDPLRLVFVLCTGMLPYMILSAFLRPGWRSILYLTDTAR